LMQDQILSSFDTVFLLLLPLTTFALGISGFLWSSARLLAPWALSFGLVSLIPLGMLVLGKLEGSIGLRVHAWISFIVLFSSLVTIFIFVIAVRFFVSFPIVVWSNAGMIFLAGVLFSTYGFSFRGVKYFKHVLGERIP
jgi:hypothetical protein